MATAAVVVVLLALSLLQLKRWNDVRHAANHRNEDIYFVPAVIAYVLFALLAIGTITLVCIAFRQAGNTLSGWVYFSSAVLCAGLCLAASIETRRTFIKFEGDQMVIQSFVRHRSVPISEIERVMKMRGAIVLRLRSGRMLLASNVLGWNVALRTRLDLLGL